MCFSLESVVLIWVNWCHGCNRSGLLSACPKSGNVPVARASEVRDVSALYQAGQKCPRGRSHQNVNSSLLKTTESRLVWFDHQSFRVHWSLNIGFTFPVCWPFGKGNYPELPKWFGSIPSQDICQNFVWFVGYSSEQLFETLDTDTSVSFLPLTFSFKNSIDFFFFCLFFLWWQNIHNINFTMLTIFKCITQWHLVQSRCCSNHYYCSYPEPLHHPELKLYPLNNSLHSFSFPPVHSNHPETLCVSVNFTGSIQYLSFHVWCISFSVFSRFKDTSSYSLNNNPLYAYATFYILSIHACMDVWAVPTFWPSLIMLL